MTNIISNPKYKGFYLQNGYKLVKVDYHPKSNKRGYVSEHRLVIEKNIGRYLKDDEVIHHVNGIRDDNRIENLEIKTNNSTHITEHSFKRNNNGQIVANEPIFQELKFRLYDKDRDITQIYSLSKLIGTTFRRGKFQFRGRFTGLKDATGKEIYEFCELNNKYRVLFKELKYVLQDISNGDIIDMEFKSRLYEITREYSPI